MSEVQHRGICFKTQGVDAPTILKHSGVFKGIRNQVKCTLCSSNKVPKECKTYDSSSLVCTVCSKRKRSCDYAALLRFSAYAHMENISVSEAADRLKKFNVGFTLPLDLYKRALLVLEKQNPAPGVLGTIDDEREKFFPETNRKRLAKLFLDSKGQGSSDVKEKEQKTSQGSASSLQPLLPLRVVIPASSNSNSPQTLVQQDYAATRQEAEPSNSITVQNFENPRKRSAPAAIEADSQRYVRPRVEPSESSIGAIDPPFGSGTMSYTPAVNRKEPANHTAEEAVNTLISQLTKEGLEIEETTVWGKFVHRHRSTIARLEAEEAKSATYHEQRERLKEQLQAAVNRSEGLEADVAVERAKTDMSDARVRALEESSSKIIEEFRKARDRVKELEGMMAERIPSANGTPEIARLQQNVKALQQTISEVRSDVSKSRSAFHALTRQHENTLRRNDHIAETNRRLTREISEAQTQLIDKDRELAMMGDLVLNSTGTSSDPVVLELQTDRDRLRVDRKLALEYATMLHQLDLPGFVWRFEQQIAEPLSWLYNFIRTCRDEDVVNSPLFVEVQSVLAGAIPSVTNAACRSQLALRAVLADFDMQFPELRNVLKGSISQRVVHTLSQNSGFESIFSSVEPVFDFDRIMRFDEDLWNPFPLTTLKDTPSPSLREAIKVFLAELEVIPDTPKSPSSVTSNSRGTSISSSLSVDSLTSPPRGSHL
ncbi:hypothetical protein BDP27DRAFT_1320881 [Rhodocollybia butyracea]|uniref:Uncharacterized protein n=1 Tax=Rhodocollybia butyracea TaxID=206335 RepID=A0A9P5Q021_9AGAR|nr:hypothetical protein BDP27DRAFT_1320881 [Rhodocollybia butyracea]